MSDAVVGGQDTTVEHSIFSAVFSNDENTQRRRQELITTFNIPSVFKDEYYIFYLVTKDFPRVTPNKDFLKLYLQTNKALFSQNTSIDLAKYRLSDTEPYVEFVNSCLALFDECWKKPIEDAEFYRSLEMHKMNYISVQSISILEESAVIVSEGAKIRGKQLNGYEDMRSNLKSQFLKLDNLVEKKDRKGVITYGYNDEDEDESGKVKRVSYFGIEELDAAIGGIFEGDMVSLLAPAKGGKSRFATYILHNAVVNGTSIAMWSIENGYKGWEALIRARHFNWFYNSKVTDGSQKRFVDADMIRKGELSPELAELELASWTDLKCNTAYGRISNIDEDFDADSFIEVIDNVVNQTGTKLICVDYLQLISDNNKNGKSISKNERIGDAYKRMLQYLKKKKIGGIFPAQLKQTVVGNLNKADEADLINTELRDAAGESYEVIKTPDVNLALYGTVEDIRNGNMKILGIPSRNSAPFEPIDIHCDLGSCTFGSLKIA